MEYVKIEGQFPKFSHCAVTLGKFDGIHRGHRKLIQTILNRKKEYGELAVVMAFVSDRQTILTSEERRILLEKMGVDILLECPLNDQIKHMKADVFIRQILKGDLQASCVVVGEDFRFGHERKGSPELLEKYGEKYDYETIVIAKEMDGNRKISSTYIREELKKGIWKRLQIFWEVRFLRQVSLNMEEEWGIGIFSNSEYHSTEVEADASEWGLCDSIAS